RVWRLVRGAMLWVGCGITVTLAAALLAHVLREGWATVLLLAAWIAWMAGSAVAWIARPLVIRPRPVEVARLVELRVDGLHNGLTNSVLLASTPDVQASPFLPAIFDEVLGNTRQRPLDDAVRFDDLRPLGLKLAAAAAPLLIL